jgi:integrase
MNLSQLTLADLVSLASKNSRTVGTILQDYLASAEFKRLKPVSQSSIRRHLERALALHDKTMAVEFNGASVTRILDDFPLGSRPIVLKRLRTLGRFAEARGWFSADPTKGVKCKAHPKGRLVWQPADTEKFRAAYPAGRERVVLELALRAQRRADIAKARWQDIEWEAAKPGQNEPPRAWWIVKQQKTWKQDEDTLRIPLHREAVVALMGLGGPDVASLKGAIVARTGSKKGLSAQGLGNLFAAWCEPVGIKARLHGIRHHVASSLAEKGATPHQIASVTGHKSLSEVARYSKAASRAGLAEQAAAILAA